MSKAIDAKKPSIASAAPAGHQPARQSTPVTKMTLRVNQDQKLLAFSKTSDNHQLRRDHQILIQIVAPSHPDCRAIARALSRRNRPVGHSLGGAEQSLCCF